MGRARRRRDGSWVAPAALRRLRATLTEERKIEEFRITFGRDPKSDEELDLFVEDMTREMYNSGLDSWD